LDFHQRKMDPRPFVNAYSARTKVGNWNEDQFRIECDNADYERLKAAGLLRHQIAEKIKSRFLGPVQTTGHGDGHLRFGDIVQVRNDALDTTLAVHTDNEITWTVSACKKGAASKRTSYRVVPCNGQADEQ